MNNSFHSGIFNTRTCILGFQNVERSGYKISQGSLGETLQTGEWRLGDQANE